MKKNCITPNCKKETKTRGLCANCYMAARNVINKGVTSWEFLEKNNLALPATRGMGEVLWTREFSKLNKN